MEKRIEQMDKVDKPVTARALMAEFESGGYAAKEIVAFDSVCKSYGAKVILNNLDLKIFRNDCIALVGANGCGKSTLLKMIMGELDCDGGEIKVSASAKLAYMPQIIEFEDDGASVLDTLRFGIGLSDEKARSVLARFHFRAEDVMKKVGALSGGEKSRLKLCLLMQQGVNFLLLDEPTNHLDIASREWIERALADFDGTMLFVSHDRYFLNQFATKIWSMADGAITVHDGGFDEYLEATRTAVVTKPKKQSPPPKEQTQTAPPKPIQPEALINAAETELSEVNAAIEAELLKSDFSKMHSLYEQKSRLEEKIDSLYNDWMKGAT